MPKTLRIIYASTSGHTEYVVEVLTKFLRKHARNVEVSWQRAEEAAAEDLLDGDVLLLASSTWNTGGPEGQLNPHMFLLLNKLARDLDLAGQPVAIIGLGDKRYRYTCRAADKLEAFVESHGGVQVGPTLRIINEPYGQEAAVEKWGVDLVNSLKAL